MLRSQVLVLLSLCGSALCFADVTTQASCYVYDQSSGVQSQTATSSCSLSTQNVVSQASITTTSINASSIGFSANYLGVSAAPGLDSYTFSAAGNGNLMLTTPGSVRSGFVTVTINGNDADLGTFFVTLNLGSYSENCNAGTTTYIADLNCSGTLAGSFGTGTPSPTSVQLATVTVPFTLGQSFAVSESFIAENDAYDDPTSGPTALGMTFQFTDANGNPIAASVVGATTPEPSTVMLMLTSCLLGFACFALKR